MQSPVRLVLLLRPSTRADLLVTTAYSSLVFTATPFLLPAVADRYDIGIGTASLISTMQLLGFVLASSLGGRLLRPSRRLLLATTAVMAVVNLASAATTHFAVLLGLRLCSGLALGVVAWMGWQEVFGDEDRMGDVAVIGPVMGIAGAPLAAWLAGSADGAETTFLALTVLALAPIPFLVRGPDPVHRRLDRRRRSRPLPATLVILGALGLFTTGGSAVFVFGAAIGESRLGLDPLLVALAFSANAALGVPAARYRGVRRAPGLWLASTAAAAAVLATTGSGALWWLSVAWWGFGFWAGVPGAFGILADRSAHPGDRAGDAQAVMAFGRVLGPLLGGALVEAGSYTSLGIVAGALMLVASATLAAVARFVPPRPPMRSSQG